MINEKITEFRISTANQSHLCFVREKDDPLSDLRSADIKIWCFQNTGVPVYSTGKTKQGAHYCSGKFCGIYSQTTGKSDQASQAICTFSRNVHQQSGQNCTGGFFSKKGSWPNKRGKLKYHTTMTGWESKSSLRFTICLSLTVTYQILIPTIIHLLNQ